MWITEYPAAALPKAEQVYSPRRCSTGMEAGLVGAVPEVPAPRLPCARTARARSGSSARATARSTTRSGEKKGGPAPRGMDRFAIEVTGGTLIVNTGAVIQGPPIGTNTTGQEAEGPHCVGAARRH